MTRSFYALLVSQTSTNLGFALYTMLVVFHLYNGTDSAALAAAVPFISVLTRMVSSIVLPSFSNRFKLSRLLLFSQISQLALLGVLYYLLLIELNTVSMILIFAVLGVISFFSGMFTPIKSSIVKQIVPEHSRVKANSLLASVDQTFLFAGWTFGGMVLAFFGKQPTLLMTVLFLLLSVVCLLFIKGESSAPIQAKESAMAALTSGWKYLFSHKGLRVLISMDIVESFFGTIWIGAVTLAFVQEALGQDETWWGYINGGFYFGTILGGVLVYRMSKMMQGRLSLFMVVGSAAFGLLTFAYGFMTVPWIALVLIILMGPFYQMRDLTQETMFQNSADEQTLTKILAAKSALSNFIYVISIISIGVLTDLIGARLIYIVSGGLLFITALIAYHHLRIRKKGLSLEQEYRNLNETIPG
ncbi:MFS transporter [Paenibacillus sp. GCM10027627]|uniref:MFS transporter n=1 Tax=unclassified Paenibacillus TaxID=185978 RepID=UPI003628B9DE